MPNDADLKDHRALITLRAQRKTRIEQLKAFLATNAEATQEDAIKFMMESWSYTRVSAGMMISRLRCELKNSKMLDSD